MTERMGETMVEAGTDRPRLAIALDVEDAESAFRLAGLVAPYFDVAKVGLELYASVGPSIVTELIERGFQVFVDLKLHDIPTTVERASRALGRLGATYATVHAAGGVDMVRAAIAGFHDGAAARGFSAPTVLGVTVLTSDTEAPVGLLAERVRTLQLAGASALVCAAPDLIEIRQLVPDFLTVVPGIRPADTDTNDQARVATPAAAVALGANILVIGRAVSHAADPRGAAEQIAWSLGLV
jgi:orotidine-5'-phosphate decarboxylase